MRLLVSDSGEVSVLGRDIDTQFQTVKHRIGFVPESHHIYAWMPIRQVIQFTRSFYPNWNDQLCDELLSLFRLEPQKKVKQLSKGMVAKLALLVAVCHEPDLLLLDEPLNGLDPIAREEFMDGVLKSICDCGTTILFSSHSMEDVQRIADRVGILHDGRLLVDSTTDRLLTDTKRFQIVVEPGSKLNWMPESTVYSSQIGREATVTVSGFSPALHEEFRVRNSLDEVRVNEVTLEEAFKDYIRGQYSNDKNEGV